MRRAEALRVAVATAAAGRRRAAGPTIAAAVDVASASASAPALLPPSPRGRATATATSPTATWSVRAHGRASYASVSAASAAAASASAEAAFEQQQQQGAAAAPSSSPLRGAAGEGPALYYRRRLEEGAWRPDARQETTVRLLQDLYDGLREVYPKPPRISGLAMVDHVTAAQSKQSWFSGITAKLRASSGLSSSGAASAAASSSAATATTKTPRGLYMFGGVGCGKTMLMDAFAESCPREFAVRRAHYHDFMLDVHSRLRLFKGERDPLARVADAVAAQCRVLCLDELFVTDVADAMILGRLFGRLWDDGLVLVATSNRAPTSLYEGGLQRQLFLPFIERLQRRCVVHDMASGVDYRRLAHHARGTYFVAPDRDAALAEAFARAAVEEDKAARDARAVAAAAATRGGGSSAAAAAAPSSSSSSSELPPALGSPSPVDIPVAMGRLLHVPRAAGRACLFHFDELCGQPVAAADYLALAERFDAVALQGIPVFTGANVASGHRFVTLVDILYENRTRLLASAEAPPFALFENVVTRAEARERSEKRRKERELGGGGGFGDNGSGTSFSSSEQQQQQQNEVVDESLGFSKDRAVSRLTEMQSAEYAAAHLEVLARRARGEPAVPHKQ